LNAKLFILVFDCGYIILIITIIIIVFAITIVSTTTITTTITIFIFVRKEIKELFSWSKLPIV
jgi:hypothetical protein